MSIFDLLPTRLYWYAGKGVVRTNVSHKVFNEKPQLGFDFESLDYIPGVLAIIRRHPWSEPDDLTLAERAACNQFLCDMRL